MSFLSQLFAPPAPTWLLRGVTAFQVFAALTSYGQETTPGKQAPYSKFAGEAKLKVPISGRLSMLLIYVPATAYCAWAFSRLGPAGPAPSEASATVAAMLLAHFGKRVFETLFVHKYSGNGDLPTSAVIGINYALQALLINSQQAQVADSLRLAWAFRVGLGLFAVGELGNLYHHYLLSTLRSKGGEKKYSVPRGGLFSLVVAPHYLFELVAWLGIAVVAQQTNAWLVLACMTSYLAGRSTATLDWYKKNVQGFPTDRKRLVPFLF